MADAAKPVPPRNVWAGTTVEDQKMAALRIPQLLQVQGGAVRFLSCEPLLSSLDLSAWLAKLHWVIAGGESGAGARPSHPDWFRSLRDQCQAAGVAFLFKQWGDWAPCAGYQSGTPGHFAFGGWEHDPDTLVQVDSYPRQFTKFGAKVILQRIGKKQAGRDLDGRTWDDVAVVNHGEA